jgi:hypothetical protein
VKPLQTCRAALFVVVLGLAADANAFTVRGKITNGTTGAVVKEAKITIIQPSAGMKEVGSLETHDGTYQFTNLGADAPIYLLRTEYHGVMYNGQVPVTGQDQEVNVEVYEPTTSWKDVDLVVPHLAATRNGNELHVEQMYEIDNNTSPPKTITAKDGGAFRMWLPADMDSITECYVMTGQMPLKVTPIPTDAKDMYSIDYPVRPGQTRIAISYYIPYPGSYTMKLKFVTMVSHMSVFAVDSTLQVSSTAPSFVRQESVHGMSSYTIHSVAANQEVTLAFSGGDPNFAGLQVDDNGNAGGGGGSSGTAGATIPSDGSISVTAGEDEKISRFLMVTVLLVLTGVVGMSLRDRHDPLSDPQVLRQHYNLLLSRLAKLDDLHAANTIPDDAYRASREDLMGRLAALAMLLRAYGGIHAPDRTVDPTPKKTKVQ